MAKKMVLVPESWLKQRLDGAGTSVPDVAPTRAEVSIVADVPAKNLSDLAQFLPKGYRQRAKILLHYLEPFIKLTDKDRVIYENGQLGSHILDLVKYFVSTFQTDRPVDAPKFAKLMDKAGVPNSAIVLKKKDPQGWKRAK